MTTEPHKGPCPDECRDLDMAEWLNTHRVKSKGPGKGERLMDASLTPFLIEILEFGRNPWAEEGVVRKAARIGFTEACIGTLVAYTIAMEGTEIGIVQPSIKEGQSYSRENLDPLFEMMPCLSIQAEAAAETMIGRRTRNDNLTYKRFPNGGELYILGTSATQLARRTFKRGFADEVDKMKFDPSEGSPIARLLGRTSDYEGGGAMVLSGSTPLIRGESIIDERWEFSDQRYWQCRCPECGVRQKVVWSQIRWLKAVRCAGCETRMEDPSEDCPCGHAERTTTHLPKTVYWECMKCDIAIGEDRKAELIQSGMWVPDNPDAEFPGWHIPAFISLLPQAAWPRLVRLWMNAQGSIPNLKVFINEVLGESFEDPRRRPRVTNLEARAEQYTDAGGNIVMVPDGAGILTAGVDVQDDRLELLVRGWGPDDESYDIVHQRFYGLPEHPQVWQELDGWLTRPYLHRSGVSLRVLCTLVDSGDKAGHVYTFVRSREPRWVFASKGDSGKQGAPAIKRSGVQPDPSKRQTLAQRYQVSLYNVGTFTMKDTLFQWLANPDPGPGFIHLRQGDPSICNGFDSDYFAQFEAEVKQATKVVHGRPVYTWVKIKKRNEAIDLQVLAAAAYELLAVRSEVAMLTTLASQGRTYRAPATGGRRVIQKRPY